MLQIIGSSQRDHKWTLVYHGESKTYHLTEHRYVEGDGWVKLNTSEWKTMDAVLSSIDVANEKRMKEAKP